MTDYKTLRVPEDAWKAAKEQKEAAGRTWGEQIVRPDGEGVITPAPHPNLEAIQNSLNQLVDMYESQTNDLPTADVKEAVREVLREELPEGALR